MRSPYTTTPENHSRNHCVLTANLVNGGLFGMSAFNCQNAQLFVQWREV